MAYIDETYIPPTYETNSETIRKNKAYHSTDNSKNTVKVPILSYNNNIITVENPAENNKQSDLQILI